MIPDFTSLNYFNLSPQGDGNESRPGEFQHPMISTYPRKGTETYRLRKLDQGKGFQLIPARGRKLFNRYRNFELVLIFQLIPARGQKLAIDCLIINTDDISTYPRKGTETEPE